MAFGFKSSSNLDKLINAVEKINNPEKRGDSRFWQAEVDKAGNGMAVIRFLPTPAVDGENELPWARVWTHGFKGPTGKWYIENSLTTLNQKDPVSEYNSVLWNASQDDNSPERKQARNQKRKLTYISNIYVVSDPKNPENEGKVFLFRFGKKIFDKIIAAMKPEFEGDKPLNVFDLQEGANFKLRIRNVEGYRNFDQSSFEAPSALLKDEAKLEQIWRSEHSLKEFTDPKSFKTYDELKALLNDVLGLNVASVRASAPPVSRAAPTPAKSAVDEDVVTFDVDEDDDELKAFKSLAG